MLGYALLTDQRLLGLVILHRIGLLQLENRVVVLQVVVDAAACSEPWALVLSP
jgi:hypothetical protein